MALAFAVKVTANSLQLIFFLKNEIEIFTNNLPGEGSGQELLVITVRTNGIKK